VRDANPASNCRHGTVIYFEERIWIQHDWATIGSACLCILIAKMVLAELAGGVVPPPPNWT
jgi:hypothetical protein